MSNYIYVIVTAISVLFNVFLFWYVRGLLSRLYFIADNMDALVDETVSFRDHLKSIYELETFYGDETLGNLIQHVKTYSEILSDFEEIYTLLDEDEETNFDDEESNNEDSTHAGEEAYDYEKEAQKTNQADVFYAGSRRRNS
tara:strand:+ start:2101 stop:2526 length:426 start_codon:yes stop_codon:yes gene_type:complete